jgi:hypothetical protein
MQVPMEIVEATRIVRSNIVILGAGRHFRKTLVLRLVSTYIVTDINN